MSIEADNVDNEASLIANSEEIIKLLRAILLGIEIISGEENLIDNIEE